MECPNCGGLVWAGAVCDSGEPEMHPGIRCPHCGECILDDEEIWVDDGLDFDDPYPPEDSYLYLNIPNDQDTEELP